MLYFQNLIDSLARIPKEVLCVSIFLLSIASLHAQTNYEIELLQSLDTASNDIIRSSIYAALSDETVFDDPNRGYAYAEKALIFAEKSKDIYSKAYANSCLGYCLFYKAKYTEALPFFKEDYQLYQSIQDTTGIIFSLSHQGDVHSYLGNNVKAIQILNTALQYAQTIKNTYEISQVYNRLGMVYTEIGELQKGLDFLNKAYEIDIQSNDSDGLNRTLNNLSVIYAEMGDFNKSLTALKRTVENNEYSKTDYEYGIYLTNVGGVFQTMGEYDSALVYYLDYLKIARNFDNQLDEAWALNQIADIQMELGDLTQSYTNIIKANKLYKRLKSDAYWATGLTTLGKIHIKQKNYDKAIEVFNQADEIAKKIGDKKREGEILKYRGQIFLAQGNHTKALELYNEALVIFKNIGSKAVYAETLYYIALSHQKLKQYPQSIQKATESLAIIQATGYRVYLGKLYQLLAKNNAEIGDFKAAYNYHIQFKNVEDSLFNVAKSNRLAELQTQFYVTEKDTENALLKNIQAENKIIIQRRTIIGFSLAGGLLILMILAAWLLNINNQKRKYSEVLEEEVKERTKDLQIANKDLQTTNIELERFAYIASHDLKEPLRNISGFTFILKRKIKHLLNDETREYMDFIIQGAKQMNELIVNVLEFSKLNGNILELKMTNLNSVINNIIRSIYRSVRDKNVAIEVESLPQIIVDETKITLTLKHLIENGIKYNNNENPLIKVCYEQNNDNHIFSVTDNGIGIDTQYKDTIFEMFKRLHTKQEYEGAGIGLAFCKKIVNQHNGDIWLEKSDANGSTFKFSIPKEIIFVK